MVLSIPRYRDIIDNKPQVVQQQLFDTNFFPENEFEVSSFAENVSVEEGQNSSIALPKIQLDDIIILPKQSKLEWDMNYLKMSRSEVLAKYKKDGADVDIILEAHQRHVESIDLIKGEVSSKQIFSLKDLDTSTFKELVKKSKLVISLGGDNHFTEIAQFLDEQLILGINSDPINSEGVLTDYTIKDLRRIFSALTSGSFRIEEWSRLESSLEGRKLPLALNDIYLGESRVQFCSHGTLYHRNKKSTFKGAGLLVSTGTGSTGWMRCEGYYLFPEGNIWPRTAPVAYFLERAPYNRENAQSGNLLKDEVLTVRSGNNHDGQLIVDSINSFPFPRGSVAQIKVSDTPLRVMKIE